MMIIIVFVVSILYLIMLTIILKAYYKDQEILENRCLQLEKRIEDYRKVYNNYYKINKEIIDEIIDEIENLKRKRK